MISSLFWRKLGALFSLFAVILTSVRGYPQPVESIEKIVGVWRLLDIRCAPKNAIIEDIQSPIRNPKVLILDDLTSHEQDTALTSYSNEGEKLFCDQPMEAKSQITSEITSAGLIITSLPISSVSCGAFSLNRNFRLRLSYRFQKDYLIETIEEQLPTRSSLYGLIGLCKDGFFQQYIWVRAETF